MFLKINSQTLKTFNNRPVYKSKLLKLYAMPNSIDQPRLAIQITKKAIRLAVTRNMVRRKIKEDFRVNSTMLDKQDYLLIISSKISTAKHEISDILMQEWKQSLKSLEKYPSLLLSSIGFYCLQC